MSYHTAAVPMILGCPHDFTQQIQKKVAKMHVNNISNHKYYFFYSQTPGFIFFKKMTFAEFYGHLNKSDLNKIKFRLKDFVVNK